MKRLVLVRHGKSSWKYDLPDHKRPLKKRAENDAQLVTRYFKKYYDGNGKFWSSYAVRAHETAKMFKKELQVKDEDFEVKEELYTFDHSELIEIIKDAPNTIDKLILFGHNPAMTILVNSLGDKYIDNVPTTGLCVIDLEIDNWKDLKKGKTLLTLFPKNLR